MSPGFFPFLILLIGCYIFSRVVALDYGGFGYFLVGFPLLILSFFFVSPFLMEIGVDKGTSSIVRMLLCLVFGVFTWLSVSKK